MQKSDMAGQPPIGNHVFQCVRALTIPGKQNHDALKASDPGCAQSVQGFNQFSGDTFVVKFILEQYDKGILSDADMIAEFLASPSINAENSGIQLHWQNLDPAKLKAFK